VEPNGIQLAPKEPKKEFIKESMRVTIKDIFKEFTKEFIKDTIMNSYEFCKTPLYCTQKEF
jgi:hypothetical protein